MVALAVGVNLLLTVAQIVGGLIAGSVALIADAIHNLSDAVTLIIAFWARKIARRPANGTMTFGYGRAEVIAALVNYTTLVVLSVWLGSEAVMRMFDPPEVQGSIVIWLAAIALVIDLATALLTLRLSRESMNIRAAFLHNLADAGTSVAVIVGGVMILLYDWRLVDPLITLAISVYILWHALSEVGPVLRILMQGVPEGMDRDAVAGVIASVEGVQGVHHLHLWQIDERRSSVEGHLVLVSGHETVQVVAAVKRRLVESFGLGHATFEVETPDSGCSERQGRACHAALPQ